MGFTVFYVPCKDETDARRIGDALLQERLVACYNIFPIQSAYHWQGAIESEGETVLILKTQPKLVQDVEDAVVRLHSYETPCVMHWPVTANADYEAWIRQETSSPS